MSSIKSVNGNDLCDADIIKTPLGFAATQYFLLSNAISPGYANKPFPSYEHLSFPGAEGSFTLRSCRPPSLNQASHLLNPKLHMEKRRERQQTIGVSQGQPRFVFYHSKAPKPCCYEVSYINANAIGHLLEKLGRKGAVCKCPIRGRGTHPEQITMAPDESQASARRQCQRFVVNHSKQGENFR